MDCEWIVDTVQRYAAGRTTGSEASRGCRISLPLLEPNGDVITIMVVLDPEHSDRYYVTDGGRLNGLLFESSPADPTSADRRLVESLRTRASLDFDANSGAAYAIVKAETLGYWAFEIGRVIASAAAVIPQRRRKRGGRRLSTHVIRRLEKELLDQGLRSFVTGPRQIKGVMDIRRRVDLSYQTSGLALGGHASRAYDVFVLAADLETENALTRATQTVVVATDLSGLEYEPTVRIVHGAVSANEFEAERSREPTDQARRFIEHAATAPKIEQYSWDDPERKAAFMETTRGELASVVSRTA